MENRTIFLIYLASWVLYLITLYVFGRRKRLRMSIVAVSQFAATAVAILMICIFLVGGGATVAQFAAGSESRMNMWSLWVDLWPVLLILTGSSALTHLAWTLIACVIKSKRKWAPVAIAGLLMSVFAFFTVVANFPTA